MTTEPKITPDALRKTAVWLEADPLTDADLTGTLQLEAFFALEDAAAEIERLTREISVRDRALEIGQHAVCHLSTASARADLWLAQARAELEKEDADDGRNPH